VSDERAAFPRTGTFFFAGEPGRRTTPTVCSFAELRLADRSDPREERVRFRPSTRAARQERREPELGKLEKKWAPGELAPRWRMRLCKGYSSRGFLFNRHDAAPTRTGAWTRTCVRVFTPRWSSAYHADGPFDQPATVRATRVRSGMDHIMTAGEQNAPLVLLHRQPQELRPARFSFAARYALRGPVGWTRSGHEDRQLGTPGLQVSGARCDAGEVFVEGGEGKCLAAHWERDERGGALRGLRVLRRGYLCSPRTTTSLSARSRVVPSNGDWNNWAFVRGPPARLLFRACSGPRLA